MDWITVTHSTPSLADSVKLILNDVPTNYTYVPDLKMALSTFIARWQDPSTGFFGPWYLDGDKVIKKSGLSPTFHVASYTNGMISYWPHLMTTLLQIKDNEYPYGWLEGGKMLHHHNMDVMRLFKLGWFWTDKAHRLEAKEAIEKMLAWCKTKILPEGKVDRTDGWSADDSAAANYSYVAAFLHHADYFKGETPFWDRHRKFPEMEDVRLRLLHGIMNELDLNDTDTRGALESLGVIGG